MPQVTGNIAQLDIRYDISIPDDTMNRAEQARSLFSRFAVPPDGITSEMCRKIAKSGISGEFCLRCTGRPLASLMPPSPPEDTISLAVDEDGCDHDSRFDIVDDEAVHIESVAYEFALADDCVTVTFPDKNVERRIRSEDLDESVEDYYYGKERNESYLGREGTPSDSGTIGLVDESDVDIQYQVKTMWDGRIVAYVHHNVEYWKGPGVPSQPIATLQDAVDT